MEEESLTLPNVSFTRLGGVTSSPHQEALSLIEPEMGDRVHSITTVDISSLTFILAFSFNKKGWYR